MADAVQISIDTAELERSEQQLGTLANNISNRRVRVSFSKAKGSAANNLLDAANQLNDIASALSLLIRKTEVAIRNTRVSFTAADNAVAQWFSSSED